MHRDTERQRRRSIRLPGYDYTQRGAYFLTIVTHDRRCLFGAITDGRVRLNPFGRLVLDEWLRTAAIRPTVRLAADECVVMPNHLHAILWLADDDAAARSDRSPIRDRAHLAERFGSPVKGSVPTIVRAFKSAATARINERRGTPGAPVWQRNYHEHVVRDQGDLERVRQYILENPARWDDDTENPTLRQTPTRHANDCG